MQFIPLTQLLAAVVACGAVFPTSSRPDEGMWPFDGLPLKVLKEKYNFEPTKEWLDHVRLGSVRFSFGDGGGGSGSFVSPNGLVMTNHHVALQTLQGLRSSVLGAPQPRIELGRHRVLVVEPAHPVDRPVRAHLHVVGDGAEEDGCVTHAGFSEVWGAGPRRRGARR